MSNMTIRHCTASLLFLVFTLHGAFADWNYARWGMTPEQVSQASDGQLRPCEIDECKRGKYDSLSWLLFGEHDEGNLRFTVFASFDHRFDPPRLGGIILRLKDLADEQALLAFLHSRYGEPQSSRKGGLVDTVLWLGAPTPADEIMFVKVNPEPGRRISVIYQRHRATGGN